MTGESDPSLHTVSATVSSAGPAIPTAPPAVRIQHHHEVLILIQTTLTFLVGALFVLTFVAQPYRIPSGSMQETLLIGDFLLVNKVVFASPGPWKPLLAYEPVKQDDIIVFHYPIDASMYLVKRVIGVPGDVLHLHQGAVYLNGHLQREPFALYIPSYANKYRDEFPTPTYTDPGVTSRWWMEMQRDVHHGQLEIPAGEYFVLGDNRNDSLDSRYWGLVPRHNIVGEPFLVYFSVVTASRSEMTGITSDRLSHERGSWNGLAGAVRWSRIFHVIH
ncbi:MAG TPA: signal peptidase I [Acidobacteriaceae bacterium]|nr:signal peptidase I [Acidobacteriaceae bacterium]